MLDQNVFAITNEQLGALDAESAVDRFRELLWAEATTLGIGKNLINVPSAINFADGGIDAEVRDAVIEGGQGIIKPGTTRYQIKTGHFRLIESSRIDEILFRPSSLKKGATRELQPRIKSCFDKDGTLVIVLFGWDEPETTDDQILDKIQEKLKEVEPAYASAKTEIWRQNAIRGFLAPYPSLALRVTGRQDLSFLTHPSGSLGMSMDVERQGAGEPWSPQRSAGAGAGTPHGMATGPGSGPPCGPFAAPLERGRGRVPPAYRRGQPLLDFRPALGLLPGQGAAHQDALHRLGHVQPRAAQRRVQR
jgi:hypothetical protein